MAAVELDHNGYRRDVSFDPIAKDRGDSFSAWATSALAANAHLVTDGLASFNAAGAQVAADGAIIVGAHKSSELQPLRWVNTFTSNAKTASTGTDHHFDFAKYRHRHMAEAQYRVNRRFDLASLVGRLSHTCVRTGPCPEHWLRLGDIGTS